MIEQLDRRISALETELGELRRRKIALLHEQIAQVEASLSTDGPRSSTRGTQASGNPGGARAGKGWAGGIQATGNWTPSPRRSKAGPKKRGRRPGKRVPDEDILPAITRLVSGSGAEGISARKVSEAIGVFYPRVVKMMERNFKRTGERKWSRYHLK